MTFAKLSAIIISSLLLFIYGCDHSSSSKVYKTHYENGAIKDSIFFAEDSIFDGEAYRFYPSGKLQRAWNYKAGFKNGVCSGFREDGSLEFVQYYHEGMVDSFYKIFYPSGKIEMEASMKDGKKLGKQLVYREDGTVSLYQFFAPADSLWQSRQYDSSEKLTGLYGRWNGVAILENLKPKYNLGDTFRYDIMVPSPPYTKRYVYCSIAKNYEPIKWDTSYSDFVVCSHLFKDTGQYRFIVKMDYCPDSRIDTARLWTLMDTTITIR